MVCGANLLHNSVDVYYFKFQPLNYKTTCPSNLQQTLTHTLLLLYFTNTP